MDLVYYAMRCAFCGASVPYGSVAAVELTVSCACNNQGMTDYPCVL